MRRLLSSGVIAVLVYTSCGDALAQSGRRADIISYPINLDGPVIEVGGVDIGTAVKDVLKSAPQGDTSGKLSKAQIKQLAKDMGLLTGTKTNPHLSFLDGDIAYWEEQHVSLGRLRLEFAARKAVLDAAEKEKVIIADQGKLSWAAQQIMAQVLKEIAAQSSKEPGTQK